MTRKVTRRGIDQVHSPVAAPNAGGTARIVLPGSDAPSVHARIRAIAESYPDMIAVRLPDRQIGYGDLIAAADRVATAILSRNPDPACPVALGPGLDPISLITCVLAVLTTGRFYVYLSDTYPSVRLQQIMEDTDPQLILSNGVNWEAARVLAEQHSGGSVRVLDIGTAEDQSKIRTTPAKIVPEDLLAIQFTSGTTGRPKGIEISHRRYLNSADASALAPGDRVAILINFNVGGIFNPLTRGATVFPYNPNRMDLSRLLRWIRDAGIQVIAPPVSLFRRLADAIPERGYLPEIREVFLHGQAVLPGDVQRFRDRFPESTRLFSIYSSTETFGITRLCIGPGFDPQDQPVPAGFPVHHKTISVIDDGGKCLPRGQVGEIAVTSRYLSPGYWRNPELTAEKFQTNPSDPTLRTFFTGDLGMVDDLGRVRLLGRKDRQAKIRGFRVELETIEAALWALDCIDEAAVVAREDCRGEKRLAAYLVVRGDLSPTIREIRERLSSRLASFMIPSRFAFMDRLPMLPNFKIDLDRLPEPTLDRGRLSSRLKAPRNDLETLVLNCWKSVLDEEEIGIGDDFFELGGDSLLAVMLIDRVAKTLGHDLPTDAIAALTTVERLCGHILASDGGGNGDGPSTHLDAREYNQLLTAIQGSQLPPANPDRLITMVNPDGRQSPLFWCFNAPSLEPRALGDGIGADQPIYSLYSGIEMIRPFDQAAVERIARHYLEEIRAIQPRGPYLLGGNCSGAKVMIEIAHQLMAQGERIHKLCCMEVFDPRLFDYPGEMLLLYGRDSHLRAYKPFAWGAPNWERRFTSVPRVAWLPGPHGEFFSPHHAPELARLIGDFLGDPATPGTA